MNLGNAIVAILLWNMIGISILGLIFIVFETIKK